MRGYVMKNVFDRLLSWTRASRSEVVPGLVLLVLLAGCVNTGMVNPEPEGLTVEETHGTRVEHFEDGRTGFFIREITDLDAATRRDFEQGIQAMEGQDYETALDFFNRVLEQASAISAPHINSAMAYNKIDRPELAEEHLLTALELIPGHPLASHEYGLLLRRSGRLDEARGIYQQALTEFPEYFPIMRNLGILCDLYLNDPECALEQYSAYSESSPEDKQIKLWISELQLRLGRQGG